LKRQDEHDLQDKMNTFQFGDQKDVQSNDWVDSLEFILVTRRLLNLRSTSQPLSCSSCQSCLNFRY